jgi:hypothetical protein
LLTFLLAPLLAATPGPGRPSRAPDLDALPGFRSPPPGYGQVAFYWWLGDPLTKERLTWQLDRLTGMGVSGLQINYAHSDKGGPTYGLTYPSEPALFSKEWWSLVQWFAGEAGRRGMAVSLSDYTLGIGQGWVLDDALKAHPEIAGAELKHEIRDLKPGQRLDWPVPAGDLLAAQAFRAAGSGVTGPPVDLLASVAAGRLGWTAPADAAWKFVAVWAAPKRPSIDPMHPLSGRAVVKHFFQPWEDRLPGLPGRGVNFFFSDELDFNLRGRIWNAAFADEFRRRKGYDLRPELPALFLDTGDRTPKVRLDYGDVMVALSEENYFQPVYDWHEQRGMIYGCDHGGRGRNVIEFGDYFRTQRWNQGPGADQPRLGRDLIKAKVASSIAHLYERPRVWLEGYYSSGWGTSSADVVDATFVNFLRGFNLLTFHGLYYSTHGGWWEWAPPCNHFRMPYWDHLRGFMDCVQRLSYVLSQGVHVCDVAVLYPVAAMEAGAEGKMAVDAAFAGGEALYRAGRDFDFLDFQSLERAVARDGRLAVAGESYRALVLPAMRTVRHSTLEQAANFVRAGGLVVAIGPLPEASERAGRKDPEVAQLVAAIFGAGNDAPREQAHPGGGVAFVARDPAGAVAWLERKIPPDLALSNGPAPAFMHRRVGPRDVFAVYDVPAGTVADVRATGRPELWDPWTGTTRPLPVLSQEAGRTRLRLPLGPKEGPLVVFSPGAPELEKPTAPGGLESLALDGPWRTEIAPTLDNRWGDFRWPAGAGFIGPEARRFHYRDETGAPAGWERPDFDDSGWLRVTCGFGEKFRLLGPLPANADTLALESTLAAATSAPTGPVAFGGAATEWRPYAFSWRWGVESDRGHQGYHGLKERLYDEFIRLGRFANQPPHRPRLTREAEPGGTRYYLWSTVAAPKSGRAAVLVAGNRPAAVWLNGRRLADDERHVELRGGANPVLLRYDRPGTGYVVFVDAAAPLAAEAMKPPSANADDRETVGTLAMRWHGQPGILPFDVRPDAAKPAGWYRFKAPPGLRAFELKAAGPVRCWIDGREVRPSAAPGGEQGWLRFAAPATAGGAPVVALRIETPRGLYGGEALPEPVRFICGEGSLAAGDWSCVEGLASYSGGLWFRRDLRLDAAQAARPATLDLGDVVASAEVRVNGRSAGVRVAPPWRFALTGLLQPGDNRLEILVCNTLANHYSTIPSPYAGNPRSGLLGPVRLELTPAADHRTTGK